MEKEKLYGVLFWEHGWHCDEFDPIYVEGPYTEDQAYLAEEDDTEYHTTVVEWREKK